MNSLAKLASLFVIFGCVSLPHKLHGKGSIVDLVEQSVDANILPLVASSADASRRFDRIVVGIYQRGAKKFYGYQDEESEAFRQSIRNDFFEIGSLTKVFTSLALASEHVRSGNLIDEPVNQFDWMDGISESLQGVKLRHLANHTSGLPRLPSDISSSDSMQPYADYTFDQARSFLANFEASTEPGALYSYSNFGSGLLGWILKKRRSQSFDDMLKDTVLRPLGLSNVSSNPSVEIIPGYRWDRQEAPAWSFHESDIFSGAGSLKATISDLLRFVEAQIHPDKTPLAEAIRLSQNPSRTEDMTDSMKMALGWHIIDLSGRDVLFHNGATYGSTSFMAIDLEAGVGVVILSNNFFLDGNSIDSRIDRAGFEILKALLKH